MSWIRKLGNGPLVLLAVVCCATLAAQAAGTVVFAAVAPQTGAASVRLPQASRTDPSLGTEREPSGIVRRNLFCSSCFERPAGPGPRHHGDLFDVAEADARLSQLKLVATFVSEADAAWSLGLVRHDNDGRLRVLAAGSSVVEGVTVWQVGSNHLRLQSSDGRLHDLALGVDGVVAQKTAPVSKPRPQRGRWNITPLGNGRFRVQRKALEAMLGDPKVYGQAKVVPAVDRHGRPIGFRLRRVPSGSVLAQAGFRDNDTVRTIAGKRITSPESLLQVLARVRNASRVTVGFARRGKPLTHDFEIVQ